MSNFLNGTDPGLRQTRTPTTDNFAAGVDFTAGSTTQLTLSADPGTEDNVEITFDGIQQHRNTYSVSGTTVTFDAAIGSGVTNVEATFTTTIPANTPANGSIDKDALASGLINAHTDTVITASDEILFGDATDSNNLKKDTVQGILDLVASDLVYLGNATGSSAANVQFTTGMDSDTYCGYRVLLKARPVTGASSIHFLVRSASTTRTTTYYMSGVVGNGSGTSVPDYVNVGYFRLDGGNGLIAATSTAPGFWDLTLYDSNTDGGNSGQLTGIGQFTTGSSDRMSIYLAGTVTDWQDFDGIQIEASSGNITVDACRVYGIKKS